MVAPMAAHVKARPMLRRWRLLAAEGAAAGAERHALLPLLGGGGVAAMAGQWSRFTAAPITAADTWGLCLLSSRCGRLWATQGEPGRRAPCPPCGRAGGADVPGTCALPAWIMAAGCMLPGRRVATPAAAVSPSEGGTRVTVAPLRAGLHGARCSGCGWAPAHQVCTPAAPAPRGRGPGQQATLSMPTRAAVAAACWRAGVFGAQVAQAASAARGRTLPHVQTS